MTKQMRGLGIVVVGLLVGSCSDLEAPPRGEGTRVRPEVQPVTGVNTQRSGLEVGVPYRIRLYTHCGIDFWTRFDGSYWDAIRYDNSTGNPPKGLGNPYDSGTMTLLSRNEAEYRSDLGKVIRFTRVQGRPEGMACY